MQPTANVRRFRRFHAYLAIAGPTIKSCWRRRSLAFRLRKVLRVVVARRRHAPASFPARSRRHAAADQARHARPTASSRRSRSDRCIATRAQLALRARDAQRASAWAISRRDFLVSACGAASTLLAMNAAYAAHGCARRLLRACPREAALDAAARALDARQGSEFIFDVQGHFVNPDRRVDAARCRRARSRLSFATERKSCAAACRARTRVPALRRPRRVHQGRLPRFRHRPHRAVVRAVDARRASR